MPSPASVLSLVLSPVLSPSVAPRSSITRIPSRGRIEAVDLLRGLLMILMALDHTRDYFSRYTINPIDPTQSWPALFITRWVTHLCAPGFIALAGASVYLQRQRGKSSAQLAHLLLTRGLWLVFLEVTVISFGWSFAWAPFLQVIWAIGIAMICLSALVPCLPPPSEPSALPSSSSTTCSTPSPPNALAGSPTCGASSTIPAS